MGFGNRITGSIKSPYRDLNGSVKADWTLANSDTTTANTDALNDVHTSTKYSSVRPVDIPDGATRALVRVKFPDGTTTFTTDPEIYVLIADANGVAMRIDSTDGDADAAATAVPIASTDDVMLDSDDALWSNPIDLDGYDLKGGTTLYALIETASSYTDGATSQQGKVYVLFLN